MYEHGNGRAVKAPPAYKITLRASQDEGELLLRRMMQEVIMEEFEVSPTFGTGKKTQELVGATARDLESVLEAERYNTKSRKSNKGGAVVIKGSEEKIMEALEWFLREEAKGRGRGRSRKGGSGGVRIR